MLDFLIWVFWILLIGVISFPITFRFLRYLPDRGYSLARIFGLLVWGYIFWLLAVLGVAQNDLGGVIFALVILALFSAWSLRGQGRAIGEYIRSHWRMVVSTEIVFLVGFSFWALVRAANPALVGTEKPMELAFINSILKSASFPPNDPWLSGYSISYYYFGYVIVSMLIRVSGVASTVAFNLMVALLFGLVCVAAYGLLNNLLILRYRKNEPWQKHFFFGGWLAPVFILLVSNLGGFLEMLHARGIGWTQMPDGSLTSKFWTWLNMPELENAPRLPFGWAPNRANYGYWWWRASRVIQDFKLDGERIEVIDEFPQFSFILADMHPHVLTMPFVLLAVGVILNIYMGSTKSAEGKMGLFTWLPLRFLHSGEKATVQRDDLYLWQWLKDPVFWLIVIITGGIAFMNLWDFPIYVGLLALATGLRQYQLQGWSSKRIIEFLETGILAGVLSILLYLPFYTAFDSQAGGFLPSLNFFTQKIYFWIMFATLLIPIGFLLMWRWVKKKDRFHYPFGLKASFGLVLGTWLVSYLITALIVFGSVLLKSDRLNSVLWLILDKQGSSMVQELFSKTMINRITMPVTVLTLIVFFFLVWGFIAGQSPKRSGGPVEPTAEQVTFGFVLLLILLGLGLTMVPEFIYLRDLFANRMNTIFKFYFQTWILWAFAAAFSVAVLWRELKGWSGHLLRLGCVLVIALGFIYPVFAIWGTTNGFSPRRFDENQKEVADWTLDGAAHRYRNNPDEMAAIDWLTEAPLGVVAEAIGGSYSDYARVSTYSGQPTVLGWSWHETQWRGGEEEKGSREVDIEMLYRSANWEQVQSILDQYDIRYVFWGSLERYAYNASTQVFENYLTPVYQGSETVIYEYQKP